MENKTEIGKAFKDKLMHLDKTPSDFVWSNIEKDLNKKRRRRFLIWFIPSILLVGLLSTVAIMNQNDQEKSGTITTQKPKIEDQDSRISKAAKTESTEKKSKNGLTKNSITKGSSTSDTTLLKKSKTIKLVKQSSKLISSTSEYEEYEVVKKYKIIVKKEKINIKKDSKVNLTPTIKDLKPTIAKKKYSKNTASKKQKVTKQKNSVQKKAAKKPITEKITTALPKETSEPKIIENSPLKAEEKKDSIIKIDSLPIKKRTVLKKEKPATEKIVVKTKPERRIYVYYGPALFGSLNNESMIDPSLSKQPTSRPVSYFYGVYIKIMYKKAGFRVGFSKLNLKTETQLDPNELIPTYSNIELNGNLSPSIIKNTFANSSEIELRQTISYYELPIEFNYGIKRDKSRLNIEAFGGISTMILDDNILDMKSNEVSKQNIGSSRNIPKINASLNAGIGFSYELTTHLQLDINPLFKYYVNMFKDDNNAKPYSLSLQSGLSYKF